MAETTWRKKLTDILKTHGETLTDIVGSTLTDKQADSMFYSGYGGSEGAPFTVWTKDRVYFPVVYDGAEWVGSVPRNPCEEATSHQGGE